MIKKFHSTLRAKRATFTFRVDKSWLKCQKMVNLAIFSENLARRKMAKFKIGKSKWDILFDFQRMWKMPSMKNVPGLFDVFWQWSKWRGSKGWKVHERCRPKPTWPAQFSTPQIWRLDLCNCPCNLVRAQKNPKRLPWTRLWMIRQIFQSKVMWFGA